MESSKVKDSKISFAAGSYLDLKWSDHLLTLVYKIL
jgi:hypothetical protein